MVQLELSDLKIKINLKDYTKQTASQMSAESEEYPVRAKAVLEMLLPSKNNDEDHKWEIDAKCFGMHLVVHNANGDKMQQSRCSFLAMARMAGLSPEELFDEVRKAAQKYLANMGAITDKFKKILTAEVLRNMERHSCRTLANIVEPNTESNLFWLRVIWPSVLGTTPVVNLFKHNGNLHMQIFVLCAGDDNQSKLSDEVVHLLAWDHHTYGLGYKGELRTLGDVLQFASWAIRSADISINPCITLAMSLAGEEPIIPDYLDYAGTKSFITKLDGQTTGTTNETETWEQPSAQDLLAQGQLIRVAATSALKETADTKESSRDGEYSPETPPHAYSPVTPSYSSGTMVPAQQDQDIPDAIMDVKLAREINEDTAEEYGLSNQSKRWLCNQQIFGSSKRLPITLLDCDSGIIHEMSKHLDTRTWGYDQWLETICTHTYNCYWNSSHHPFNKYVASKPSLPFRISEPRILGSFVNALQSYKAFDLTYGTDGPDAYHVILPAMIRNKRTVTTYLFKIEWGACISEIKDVIEAEEGLHNQQQQWYSTITGVNAEPDGPFGACAVGNDKSRNGMAYYLQQGGLYLDMTNHTVRNFVYPNDRKPNERKRLHRRPDGTYHCRRYSAWEPELPSGKRANRFHWKYAATTPKWAIDSNTEVSGERAISNPAWMYATETGTVSNSTNSIELCEQSSAIVAEVAKANNESKLGTFKEQHLNLNMSGLTMAKIDQLEQLKGLIEKRCLRSNRAKKPKPEVITVVIPLSAKSAALCMVDGQTTLDDLEFDLASSGWVHCSEQWTLHAKGEPIDLRSTISEAGIKDLEVLTVLREGRTDLQREQKIFSAFDHVLKIGIASPVKEIRPCISESEAQRDFRIANIAGLIYHNMSTGILQSDCNALTKTYAQMRVAAANNSVAMMAASSSDNDLHNMWQVYNAAAWRTSVHESCRDINMVRTACSTFKTLMSEEFNQWHLNTLKQTFHQAVVGHNAISVYGQNTSDWSARARELENAARCMRSQAKKAETEAWLSQLKRWSGGDKNIKGRAHGNFDIFDQVTEINIDALTQWCEQHKGMRIKVAWRVLRRAAHTLMRHESRMFMYRQAKQIAREGAGVQITMIIPVKEAVAAFRNALENIEEQASSYTNMHYASMHIDQTMHCFGLTAIWDASIRNILEGAQLCSTLDCREKIESFGRTACCVEHFIEVNACRSDTEAKREFGKYHGAASRLAELEALAVRSQVLDKVRGDNDEVACRRCQVLFQLEACPRGSLFKQFCSTCYSTHKLECSLTLDGNKRSDARSQLAAMVFNRMFDSDDDEAATLESILDPFVRNKTLSASAAEAFCKKGNEEIQAFEGVAEVWAACKQDSAPKANITMPASHAHQPQVSKKKRKVSQANQKAHHIDDTSMPESVGGSQSLASRSPISSAKWAFSQWPKRYVIDQMHCDNDQALHIDMLGSQNEEPIAAYQVDYNMPPLQRYKQARMRLLEPDDQLEWNQRVMSKFPKRDRSPTPQREQRTRNSVVRFKQHNSRSSSINWDESMSSSVSNGEMRKALGKTDNACWAMEAAAELTLKARSIDFTRSLPDAMRLPVTSSESIKHDHKSRHKQSKLGQYFGKRLPPVQP